MKKDSGLCLFVLCGMVYLAMEDIALFVHLLLTLIFINNTRSNAKKDDDSDGKDDDER